MTKGWWRKFGDRAVKECVLTWGDLGVEPERAPAQAVIEESADAVVGGDTEGLKERRAEDSRYRRTTASDAHFDGARTDQAGVKPPAAQDKRYPRISHDRPTFRELNFHSTVPFSCT